MKGPSNYMSLLVNRASMTGMVVFDYASRYAEAAREMAGWMATGQLKSREDIVEDSRPSRDPAEAVQGREHRQAGAESRGRLTAMPTMSRPCRAAQRQAAMHGPVSTQGAG